MPRAAKPKAAAAPAKKAGAGKKNKLYDMPEKVKDGTVLTDMAKGQWRIGPSIGIGGFGEIYAACRVGERNYDAVVKCEPHGNGPLFVEMHFYIRNAKQDDIKLFKQKHGLKSLGMPYILGNGSADVNGQKHRFIVMPRYGTDVSKFYESNGKRLPEATVYRLAIQMLDVYEYMHSTGYVHADLKAANILLGPDNGGSSQAYLVDFGLASHYATGDFKPDPKKMHNGTIEYTSRDAHQGVATRRADLEILGYNLIEWLGVELPWIRDKLLAVPVKVQKAKEAFMSDVATGLKQLFPKGVPAAIAEFMKYVAKLTHNEAPDYGKCRNTFLNALKQMKVPNSGVLDFKLKPPSNNNNNSPGNRKPAAAATAAKAGRTKVSNKKNASLVLDTSSEGVVSASEEENDDDSIFEPKPKPSPGRRKQIVKITPTRKVTAKVERRRSASPSKRLAAAAKSPSPTKRTAVPSSSPMQRSPKRPKTEPTNATPNPTKAKHRTPGTASSLNTKLNFSPSLSLRGKPGRTVVNDDLTPNPRSNKTYEFNFELDVSMDANVIVNVKRKKKAAKERASPRLASAGEAKTPTRSATSNGDTPVTRVNLRKLDGERERGASRSPRTPAVTVRKYKH